MSSPEPRRGRGLSRSQRVDRGANLVMASMASAAVFVVSLVLSIAGVIGGTLPLLSLILGAILGFSAYRSVKSRS
jgi:hypothetical protein